MPPYPVPDAANPRVRRTRDRMLEAARALLAEAGPAGLTYSVLAVTAQADTDPDSAQALARITEDRLDALNVLLAPSGVKVSPEEYALLAGPVMSRIFFERGEVSDEFLGSIATRWLASRAR
jgi:hypothetical protein